MDGLPRVDRTVSRAESGVETMSAHLAPSSGRARAERRTCYLESQAPSAERPCLSMYAAQGREGESMGGGTTRRSALRGGPSRRRPFVSRFGQVAARVTQSFSLIHLYRGRIGAVLRGLPESSEGWGQPRSTRSGRVCSRATREVPPPLVLLSRFSRPLESQCQSSAHERPRNPTSHQVSKSAPVGEIVCGDLLLFENVQGMYRGS